MTCSLLLLLKQAILEQRMCRYLFELQSQVRRLSTSYRRNGSSNSKRQKIGEQLSGSWVNVCDGLGRFELNWWKRQGTWGESKRLKRGSSAGSWVGEWPSVRQKQVAWRRECVCHLGSRGHPRSAALPRLSPSTLFLSPTLFTQYCSQGPPSAPVVLEAI